MVLGTGIDVIEVGRMRRELQCAPWSSSNGVFRERELQYCNATRDPHERFASVFAAKEAAAKALGIGMADLACFQDFEILPNSRGAFNIRFHGRARQKLAAIGQPRALTAWHSNHLLAAAMVILEG